MKAYVLLLLMCSAAHSQTGQTPDGKASEQERSRIQAERAQLEERFAGDEAQCYQKFAVTDCLNRARTARREAIADLRRQELSLNAADAKRRGAEQLTRLEEKSSPQAIADDAARRAQALDEQKERQRAFDEKTAERTEAANSARQDDKDAKARAGAQKLSDRALKAQEASAAQKRYDEKLKEAQMRKDQRQKRLAEQPRVQVKPLPAQRQ